MKLHSLKLKNFRGYRDETIIPISNLTAFIGRNDAGKSSILEALEIFFNSTIVSCERDDLSVNAVGNNIEISCIFSDLPDEIVIDADAPTSLTAEHLLNSDSRLEIKKVWQATAAKPKEKIYIVCQHPSVVNGSDLLDLKRAELRARADALGIDAGGYNRNVNSTIRAAIWNHLGELNLAATEMLVDKEDAKKVYDTLKAYLPIYALFQSDRQSNDDDKEVADPMKIAVQQALQALEAEIAYIKEQVKQKTIETATRTLAKLKEMAPDLAEQLVPEFKTEPKFDSQFKLTIKSDNDIPINKRGSGVRRLVLLNFFRAEAERRRQGNENSKVIYAFEEPETSQHPDHQEMLIKAFLELSAAPNTQVLLTTHTPALAGLLPLDSLRYINAVDGNRTVEYGSNEVFGKIVETLGLLPDPLPRDVKAILLVEGKSDVTFVRHTALKLKEAGHLAHTLDDKKFAIIPVGGCGNLKHWRTLQLAEQFNVPYCVLLDSDLGTPEEVKNVAQIQELRNSNIKAHSTRRREPENYIHLSVLNLPAETQLTYTETCDAKVLIGQATTTRKDNVLDFFWPRMTSDLIREVEAYNDNGNTRYEFTEILGDYLDLVPA